MLQEMEKDGFNRYGTESYHRTQMQKDRIIQKLKERGCRITRQRLLLLDIILEEKCSCCKEIFYKAARQDEKIGSATVYRMINTLEDIGAISRKNMYRIACGEECDVEHTCTVKLDDGTVLELSDKQWYQIVQSGLVACGLCQEQKVCSITTQACECFETGLYCDPA